MPKNQNLLKLTVLERSQRHDGCAAIHIALGGLEVVEPAQFTAALEPNEALDAMNAILACVRESLPELFDAEPDVDHGLVQCARGSDCRP